MKRTLLAIGIGLAVTACVVLVFYNQAQKTAALEIKAARLDDHCYGEREQVRYALHNLHPGDRDLKSATFVYEMLEADQWREAAPCVPLHVTLQTFCSTDDVPCMTWGFVNALRWMDVR